MYNSSLVLNWHLTQACNYRCQYCYATWDAPTSQNEILFKPARTVALLQELSSFFRSGNMLNPLAKQLQWDSVRLNFAGGEPLLYAGKLLPIAKQARALGFEVSIITNGSLLNKKLLKQLAPQLTWLGISLDSVNPTTNIAIGRTNRCGKLIDLNELADCLNIARQSNPTLRIKINTVVNRLNHNESLSPLLWNLSPDKWKVLRMLPVVNKHLTVTDKQFTDFVARHQDFARILCAEDNQDMRESYLMVDPRGRFFQNSSPEPGAGYIYSKPILDVGAQTAFNEVNFAHKRFCARYPLSTLENTHEVLL